MQVTDGIARPGGSLTLEHATRILAAGEQALSEGVNRFDFSAVDKVDSSALSLILCWRRRAQALGRELEIINLPESMASLAALYGVSDLLRP